MNNEKPLTPIKAIRANCLMCSGDQPKEVRLCSITYCPLYPYRMGRRPTSAFKTAEKNGLPIMEASNISSNGVEAKNVEIAPAFSPKNSIPSMEV